MHDAVFVRGFEGLGNLARDDESFVQRDGPSGEAVRERDALHQFHHQIVGSDVEEGANVWMVQCGNGAGFLFESLAETRD